VTEPRDENVVENIGPTDSIEVEIKGPDPLVWGDDEDRPRPSEEDAGPPGLAIGEIINEGTDEELKGPGPAWETDEDGNYINR
jgi:hypothetical protein